MSLRTTSAKADSGQRLIARCQADRSFGLAEALLAEGGSPSNTALPKAGRGSRGSSFLPSSRLGHLRRGHAMSKKPWILGLASSHNGGACVLHGNEIVVAIQEERLLRVK